MNYENLFIGDFSDEDKNKIYINEPLDTNTIKFTNDGFTIKLENGVELIHVANGIVIRVAQGKETPMKPYKYRTEGDMSQDVYECIECETVIFRNDKYCRHCGQKLNWEDLEKGED